MQKRTLFVIAAVIAIAGGIVAMLPDGDGPGVPPPAKGDPQNPAAPAPSD
jgi:hypothetical protein